jgi:hypothetical protein
MRTAVAIRSLLFCIVLMGFSAAATFAQIGIGISVGFGPPALPVYEQPICPVDGYLWTPGYWDYSDDGGYFWVPGTWVEPPEVGFLWTPGYWGWGDGGFFFHTGYWGPHIGFYGGINYGFGYFGHGYEGGRWDGGHFFYNTEVNRVDVNVHNTYVSHVSVDVNNHVSYNGHGGVDARPSAEEQRYDGERHVGPIAAQTQHVQEARSNPQLRASVNQGRPSIAATSRPGDFKGGVVAAREAGGTYHAPERGAASGGGHPNPAHASEIDAHKPSPVNSGDANRDQKYQQQQQKLADKQNQEHQKLQQQQEREHQQAQQKNYNDQQKQQMEQRHQQQTQQLEEKHTTEQQHLQQRQAPASHPAGGGRPH